MTAAIEGPPYLAAPQPFSRPTRSPNSSPTRQGRDKSRTIRLIRDISPTTALRAFSEDDNLALGEGLQLDLTGATPAEKELGIRISIAAQKLRSWCYEIEHWGWSGTFELEEDKKKRKWIWPKTQDGPKSKETVASIQQELGRISLGLVETFTDGPIPRTQVEQCERRLDAIVEELGELEMDELKDHILGLHRTRSRPSSSYSSISVTNLMMMDDFSILVTHTLMQSLPYLTILRNHLDTWTIRLAVLSEAPSFVTDLCHSQRAMRLGWDAISLARESSATTQGLALEVHKDTIGIVKNLLQQKLTKLGQTLDQMLDSLEGRDDRLPNSWIDEFEVLEADYSRWTTEAQRSILEMELRSMKTKIHWVPQAPFNRGSAFFSNLTRRTSDRSDRNGLVTQRSSTKLRSSTLPNVTDVAATSRPPPVRERSASLPSPILPNDRTSMHSSPTMVNHAKSQSPTIEAYRRPDAHTRSLSNGSTNSRTSPSPSRMLRIMIPSMHSAEGPNDGRNNFPAQKSIEKTDLQPSEAMKTSKGKERAVENTLRRASLTSVRSVSSAEVRNRSGSCICKTDKTDILQIKQVQVRRSPNSSLPNSPVRDRHSFNPDYPHSPISPVDRLHSEGNTPVSPIRRSRASSLLHSPQTPLEPTQEEPALFQPPTSQPYIIPVGPDPRDRPHSHHAPVEATSPQSPQNTIRDEEGLISQLAQVPSHDTTVESPTPVVGRSSTPPVDSPSSLYSEEHPGPASPQESEAQSPSSRASTRSGRGALNAAMAKRRNVFRENSLRNNSIRHVSAPLDNASAGSSITDLDQQISNILTTLPTPIRLATNNRRASIASNSSASSRNRLTKPLPPRSRAPSLTLARAPSPLPDDRTPHHSSSRSNRRSLNPHDDDVKLYHLMSSARPGLPPHKLFIRRVGENGERVMVRVGGGWADLGEYLRQYAEHHGRKAVSGNVSNSVVTEMEGSPTISRPELAMSFGSRRSSMATPVASGTPILGATATPMADSSMRSVSPISFSTNVGTPEVQVATPVVLAGNGSDSSNGTTPPSAQSNVSAASGSSGPGSVSAGRRSWGGNEVGLSGPMPKARKPPTELDEEKQSWIEGMVERARKVSGNAEGKGKENRAAKGEFEGMGTVGGTRRVYMRG